MSSAHPDGFRWTLRRLALVPVVYFALVALVLGYSLRSPEAVGAFNAPTLVVLLLPWALGAAIAIFRRADPMRNWIIPVLTSLYLPAALLCYDAHLTLMFSRSENAQIVLMALATNALFIAWYVRFLTRLSPRTCPGCGQRGLVPLARLWGDDPRTPKTRWCANCGGKFWPDRQGVWQPERRLTWDDPPQDEFPLEDRGPATNTVPAPHASPAGSERDRDRAPTREGC